MAKDTVKKSVEVPAVSALRIVQITKIVRVCEWHQHFWDHNMALPKTVVLNAGETVSTHLEYTDITSSPDSDLL